MKRKKRLKKTAIIIIPFIGGVFLTYMLRYQWLGYWKTVEIDYTSFSVRDILHQLDKTIDNHMKLAGNNGYGVQKFQITPDTIYVSYNGYNKNHDPYVLYMTINRPTNRAMFSVEKSSKAYRMEINLDEWNFELEYFSDIFGYDCGYIFHHPIDKDELRIFDENGSYSANLYDGSYK